MIDADRAKPRPSLDIVTIRTSRQSDILKLLRERKIPLDRVAIADKGSGALYVAVTLLGCIGGAWLGRFVGATLLAQA